MSSARSNSCSPSCGTEQSVNSGGQEIAPADAPQSFEILIGQDRMRQLQRVAMLRRLFEDVALRADIAGSDMTSSSRIGSMAGLVTCANNCLK